MFLNAILIIRIENQNWLSEKFKFFDCMPPPPPPAPAPPPVAAAPPAPRDLLKSIEKGAKLKKTVTNDRSAPLVEGKFGIAAHIKDQLIIKENQIQQHQRTGRPHPVEADQPVLQVPNWEGFLLEDCQS